MGHGVERVGGLQAQGGRYTFLSVEHSEYSTWWCDHVVVGFIRISEWEKSRSSYVVSARVSGYFTYCYTLQCLFSQNGWCQWLVFSQKVVSVHTCGCLMAGSHMYSMKFSIVRNILLVYENCEMMPIARQIFPWWSQLRSWMQKTPAVELVWICSIYVIFVWPEQCVKAFSLEVVSLIILYCVINLLFWLN